MALTGGLASARLFQNGAGTQNVLPAISGFHYEIFHLALGMSATTAATDLRSTTTATVHAGPFQGITSFGLSGTLNCPIFATDNSQGLDMVNGGAGVAGGVVTYKLVAN